MSSQYYDQYHVGYASFFQCPESMCRYPQCTIIGRPLGNSLSLPQCCGCHRAPQGLTMAPILEKAPCGAAKYLYKV